MAIPAHYARDCRVSCARAHRHTRRRAGACYARVLVARVGGAGFGLLAFWWVLRAVWCGCPLPFSAVVVGGLSVVVLVGVWCGGVCGWVYSLALTRSRLTDSRKTRARLTACGCPLACRWCPCRRWCPSANLIFLALIIFAVWWGVFYSQTATEKRRTVCVRSLSLPRTFLRTPNTSVR